MTVFKKHSASQRHPAGAFFLTFPMGLLLWLVAMLFVQGIPSVKADEPAGSAISFFPTPVLAQKDPAAKPKANGKEAKEDRKKSAMKFDGKQVNDKDSAQATKAEFSPEEETVVQKFVATNHPELEPVLGSLKKKHAREYAKAINDLSQTHAKLEQVRKHDKQRYQRDLEAWQLKSRIQLLVARIQLSPNDEKLRAELKTAVTEQVTQQREQLKAERERLAQRIEKLDAQLEKLSGDSTVQVEQRMKQWLASAEKQRGSNALKKKGANGVLHEKNSKVKLKKSPEPAGSDKQ